MTFSFDHIFELLRAEDQEHRFGRPLALRIERGARSFLLRG